MNVLTVMLYKFDFFWTEKTFIVHCAFMVCLPIVLPPGEWEWHATAYHGGLQTNDDRPRSRSAPGRSAPRPLQTRSIRPNFWDDQPQVLGRSAPIKLHQIWTEVGIHDDTPWTIAVGWIGNSAISNGMNVQHALASSRLTPVEWADLWRHPSSMSRDGAARSAQQWSRLNVWSNAKTGR